MFVHQYIVLSISFEIRIMGILRRLLVQLFCKILVYKISDHSFFSSNKSLCNMTSPDIHIGPILVINGLNVNCLPDQSFILLYNYWTKQTIEIMTGFSFLGVNNYILHAQDQKQMLQAEMEHVELVPFHGCFSGLDLYLSLIVAS